MLKTFLDERVIAKVGDLTVEDADAIVNAANSTLLGGGGVDGAIHAVGGPAILEDCKKIRQTAYPEGLPTGEAVITTAGLLPARFVIHTVGPVYGKNDGLDAEFLADCYRKSIRLAAEHFLATIAFPAISTGIYGYPKDEAAVVSSAAIRSALEDADLTEVRLVFHSSEDARIFLENCRFG
jgi:O-acetyl-ADP-ribose deacetylase